MPIRLSHKTTVLETIVSWQGAACIQSRIAAPALKFALISALLPAILAPQLVQAQSPASSDVDTLSQLAMQKELELDKLTSQTHLSNNLNRLSKRRRLYLWAMSNSGPTEAGLIDATTLFFKHWHHLDTDEIERMPDGSERVIVRGRSNTVSPGANAGQLYPQIIGQEANFAGDSFELVYNAFFRRAAAKKALDPKSSLIRAKQIVRNLDALLAERDAAVSQMEERKQAYEAEGRLLQDMRSSLLAEYERVYVGARREFVWQNTMAMDNNFRNAIGATGNQISVHASYIHSNGLNGTGNLLSMFSAIGITTRPWVALAVSSHTARSARKQVAHEFPAVAPQLAASPEIVKEDAERLKNLVSENSTMHSRSATLEVEARLMDRQADLANLEENGGRSARAETTFRHTMYGPTKFANSTIGVIADYSNIKDRTITNHWQASGNLTYTSGQGLNILEIHRARIEDEVRTHRLQQEGRTADQNLRARLNVLDDLIARTKINPM